MDSKYIYLFITLIAFIFSCSEPPQTDEPTSTDFADNYLLSTINLEIDSSIVVLEDYVSFPKEIDSIIAPQGLGYRLIDDGQNLLLLPKKNTCALVLIAAYL